MVIVLWIILIIILLILALFFIIPWFFGAPYDITREKSLKNIVKLANPKKDDKIAELGSGDGRVCIALALKNKKAEIHGYEINPLLVWISRRKIRKLNLNKSIKIHWKSFWNVNLGKFNKIIFFQFNSITGRLESKFNKELKKGTIVISHNWKLPNWKIKRQLGKQHLSQGVVYEYKKS